jgi:hypothetical protein
VKTDVKATWVAALRSGEYSQTQGSLRYYAGYCCLGVLCEVTLKGGWHTPDFAAYGFKTAGGPEVSNDGLVLHEDGTSVYLHDLPNRQLQRLVYLNDRECADFNTIADWIDANVQPDPE